MYIIYLHILKEHLEDIYSNFNADMRVRNLPQYPSLPTDKLRKCIVPE